MTASPNTVQFASIRILAEDLEPCVRFYEAVTGGAAQWLTDDFVEVVTPSATVAVSHPRRVKFLDGNRPPATKDNVIYEFLVADVKALDAKLRAQFGDELTVLQPLKMMPWGNMSLVIRDPEGAIVNLYTPVTPGAMELQQQRQPQLAR